MSNDHVGRVTQALASLCEPLHDAFAWAEQIRQDRLPELATDPAYGWHGTHTVRALAHHKLRQLGRDLAPWTLTGNHSRNGELWLYDGNYRIRVLHALSPTDVPPPGGNAARRAYYRNLPLPTVDVLFGPPDDQLLALWRIHHATAMPAFRIVRPIGNWNFGSHAMTDLDFPLPQTAEALEEMQFEPTDEDLGLDLPTEEQEGGAEDAGGNAG